MNFAQILDFVFSFFFPHREESLFFKKWNVSHYQKKLRPSFSTKPTIHALFSYKDPLVRKLIRSIKKEKAVYIGNAVAELFYDEVLSLFEDSAFDMDKKIFIVPIPISKKRFRERGFNQSAWISKILSQKLGPPFVYAPYLLRKIKDTKKQALLHRRDRLRNPIGSFQAGNVVKGSLVILLDDVITTGATVAEAKKVLRKAGIKRIEIFCIAH